MDTYCTTAPNKEVVSSQHRAPAWAKALSTWAAVRRMLRRQHGGVLRPASRYDGVLWTGGKHRWKGIKRLHMWVEACACVS